MSHFAEIDKNYIVLRVIVAEQDFIASGAVGPAANWIQTSYNNSIRKNFAGVWYVYDPVRDAFIAPKPDDATGFDEETCRWIVPILAQDGEGQ